jgi:formylglycine-generating enzyme required for sulfatase activity
MRKSDFMRNLFILLLLAGCGDSTLKNISCPQNYTLVGPDPYYGGDSFCVARYEMKSDEARGTVTEALGVPWVSISQKSAITRCKELGERYDLISNTQWQTIARNIEGVPANWSSGVVGSGYIFEGHGDGTPSAPLEVLDQEDPFSGTGQTGGDQKRTHLLSSGEVIWDFSGNVWEWVKDLNSTDYGANGYMSLISDITNPNSGSLDDGISRTLKNQFGPAGNYFLTSSPYGHLGHAFVFLGTAGGIVRGGSFVNETTALEGGIYSVKTNLDPDIQSGNIGFRCVYLPPAE